MLRGVKEESCKMGNFNPTEINNLRELIFYQEIQTAKQYWLRSQFSSQIIPSDSGSLGS